VRVLDGDVVLARERGDRQLERPLGLVDVGLVEDAVGADAVGRVLAERRHLAERQR